jgi:hydroxyethylthiazole kinase-like uncharacterized protein yjeF
VNGVPTPPPAAGQPLLTGAAIRDLERRGLAATPAGTLMDRAAAAVARAAADLLRTMPAGTPVLALAGPGNNGGDALLAALELARRGWRVRAIALSAAAPHAADARRAWQRWHAAGRALAGPEALEALLAESPLVVDGLFGIGLDRPLPPAVAAIVARLAEAGVPVVAVDVPSGLDADRGAVVGGTQGAAVRAGVTVTMIADKPGLHTGAGAAHAGRVVVADLGLPALGLAPALPPEPADRPWTWGRLVDAQAAGALRPARARDAHKGRFGDVVVVAGPPSMRGAATLAALGAQAVGAGRIFVGLETLGAQADALHPELMARALRPAADEPIDALGPADALVAGCGLGRDPPAARLVALALDHPAALVLDADGLNAVAAAPALHARLAARAPARRATVLTPHPLEAARLLGATTADVQADRIGAAHRLARASGAVVVLKGPGSVVAAPDGRWSVNGSGGPILATAGSGDVLAGAIGGLLAAGLPPWQAATLGAWLHGAAGDRLAARPGWRASVGLPASRLPAAIRATVNRPAARSEARADARSARPAPGRG